MRNRWLRHLTSCLPVSWDGLDSQFLSASVSLTLRQFRRAVARRSPKAPDGEVVAAGRYCAFSQTSFQLATEGSFFSTSLKTRSPPSKR
jgi:hypothetical protein